MISLASVMLLGFLLGLRHAVDPDHVVAVATIVSGQASIRRGALVGALWGIGHSVTLVGAGVLIVTLDLVVAPWMGLSMELAVAVMLVALGIASLAGARHTSPPPAAAARMARPLVVGLVHGVAGSASIALLVLVSIRDPLWVALYLLVFGLGTIVGMMLLTTLMAWPLARADRRLARVQPRLASALGVSSVVLGLVLAYRAARAFLQS
jgi:high-affinity nickel-transport protein